MGEETGHVQEHGGQASRREVLGDRRSRRRVPLGWGCWRRHGRGRATETRPVAFEGVYERPARPAERSRLVDKVERGIARVEHQVGPFRSQSAHAGAFGSVSAARRGVVAQRAQRAIQRHALAREGTVTTPFETSFQGRLARVEPPLAHRCDGIRRRRAGDAAAILLRGRWPLHVPARAPGSRSATTRRCRI
jgi:hypothetical protein